MTDTAAVAQLVPQKYYRLNPPVKTVEKRIFDRGLYIGLSGNNHVHIFRGRPINVGAEQYRESYFALNKDTVAFVDPDQNPH